MTREFDAALSLCLEMLERGVSLEECLEAFPQQATELRPLLAVADRVRSLEVPAPSSEAIARGRQGLLATVGREPTPPRWRFLARPLVPVAAAVAVAALALIGLTVAGPLRGAFDLGTKTAVADGTVTAVAADTLWIDTEDGVATIRIDKDTRIEGPRGSSMDLEIIAPGAEVRVHGDVDDDGSIAADRIEVRVRAEAPDGLPGELEFEGRVAAVAGGTLTVTTSAGMVTVVIGLDTEVDGQVQPGVMIKVHGERQADGTVVAREIDVMAPGAGLEDGVPGELEFEGQVAAIANGTLTVITPAGTVTVVIGLDTEVDGQMRPGVMIKVHGARQSDGTVLAREIDVMPAGATIGEEDEADADDDEPDADENGRDGGEADADDDEPDADEDRRDGGEADADDDEADVDEDRRDGGEADADDDEPDADEDRRDGGEADADDDEPDADEDRRDRQEADADDDEGDSNSGPGGSNGGSGSGD